MTLAQGDYCKRQALDPQDPPCARVILSGTASRIHNGTEEETFASNAVFSRRKNAASLCLFWIARLSGIFPSLSLMSVVA